MNRYLCITVTVFTLVITGVVLSVHHSTEDSKRKSFAYESALVGSSYAITTFPASASTQTPPRPTLTFTKLLIQAYDSPTPLPITRYSQSQTLPEKMLCLTLKFLSN